MLINYISIKQSIGRFLKECGLDDTSYVEDIPQWVEDAINIIGIPNYYTYRYKLQEVSNSRCPLPCDIENLFGVYIATSLTKAENTNSLRRLFIRNSPLFGKGIGYETNNGASSYGSINGNYLHTSFDKGLVYFVYKGIPLDCDGFPLVPKDGKLNEALQYYFIYRMSLSGFKHPVVSYIMALQMWEKLYPAAGNSINWMDLQEYQEFTEMWTNQLLGDLHANNYIH